MNVQDALYTIEEFELLPEGFPAQLIDGILVKDPPVRYSHQSLGSLIRAALFKIVDPRRVPDHPSTVKIDRHNAYNPDIVVIEAPLAPDALYMGVPQLAFEILSRRTRKRDLHVKTPRLLELGVPEVWIIDEANRSIEVHTRDGHRVHRGADEARSAVLPAFALVPARLFAAAGHGA